MRMWHLLALQLARMLQDTTNAVQIELDLTGSAEEGCEARVQSGQALGATTAMPQASNSLNPQPAKHLSAAAAVKISINTRGSSSRGKFIK